MLLSDFLAQAEPGISPGDDRHQRLITASKVSACVVPSRSPYESFDSLYRQLAGLVPKKQIDESLAERGHMLEPAMADWFQYRHPEWVVVDPHEPEPLTWFHGDDFAATPDRILTDKDGEVIGLLEVKTALRPDGWGEDDSSDIPAHYYDQCQWQMFCTGLDVVHVVALVAMSYHEFVVTRDDAHIAELVASAQVMLKAIRSGVAPLSDPVHKATYQAVRDEHPEITDEVAVLDFETATGFIRALEKERLVKAQVAAAKARVADAMGNAGLAVFDVYEIAKRQARRSGSPYVTRAKGAPALCELEVW